jgi:ABC-type nitrate/sulfonate/bicarbonate transport system ATPase subunit
MQMQDLLAEAIHTVGPTVIMVTHDVDEALYLADRIVILGQRPATVVATVRVPLARPRDRGDATLAALRTQILTHFGFAHTAPAPIELARAV